MSNASIDDLIDDLAGARVVGERVGDGARGGDAGNGRAGLLGLRGGVRGRREEGADADGESRRGGD